MPFPTLSSSSSPPAALRAPPLEEHGDGAGHHEVEQEATTPGLIRGATEVPCAAAQRDEVDLNDLETMDLSPDATPLERVEPFVQVCVQALGPYSAPDTCRASVEAERRIRVRG